MNRSILGLAVTGIMLCSCQSNSYQITGYARHFQDGDTIWLATEEQPETPFAEAYVNGGKFYFTGEQEMPQVCRVYPKQEPECIVSFFLEPGHITLEMNLPPDYPRVSGTKVNNAWQQLCDSIEMLGREAINIAKITSDTSPDVHLRRLNAIDSLHRRMSQCILNTASRNRDNALGRYIHENYKEPEFD